MAKNKKFIAGCIISFLLLAQSGHSKVTGPCVNCHTMHNSQGGDQVSSNLVMTDGSAEYSSNTNPALLNTNCIGCHQGSNSLATLSHPYVLDIDGPDYGSTGTEGNTLAGGNFHWVSIGFAATGHNVAGVAPPEDSSRLGNIPPGGEELNSQLTCAGTTGCHGDRSVNGEIASILTSHHNNDPTIWKDGKSLPTSYRFLNGIQGLEDQQYEYKPSAATHHNKYYGSHRTNESDPADGTISSLCAACHGDFHNTIAADYMGSGAWLRHPTDFDMSRAVGSEYQQYGGIGNEYSVISPVATESTTNMLNKTVFTENNDAIVMCLSCHRAHGTPYDAILRWDYKTWPDPAGYNGCAVCHTSKD